MEFGVGEEVKPFVLHFRKTEEEELKHRRHESYLSTKASPDYTQMGSIISLKVSLRRANTFTVYII